MKTLHSFISEAKTGCPIETHDLTANLKNRQTAIDKYGYGPFNPEQPNGEFWKKKANMWHTTATEAKKQLCGDCAAFNISDKMRGCMAKGIGGEPEGNDPWATIHKADLGYCTILHFKCAGTRTCDAWLTGGVIDNKDLTHG
jgi:hypothetical protein